MINNYFKTKNKKRYILITLIFIFLLIFIFNFIFSFFQNKVLSILNSQRFENFLILRIENYLEKISEGELSEKQVEYYSNLLNRINKKFSPVLNNLKK
jgi:predicted PurR-regulated permease PerM